MSFDSRKGALLNRVFNRSLGAAIVVRNFLFAVAREVIKDNQYFHFFRGLFVALCISRAELFLSLF